LRAVLLRAVLLRAGDFRAVDLRAVDLRAVERLAVDFLAADLRVVPFLAVRLAVDFFAVPLRAAVERFAVPFFAVVRFAVDFRAVLFFAVVRLAVDFLAGDLRVLFFAVDFLAVDFFAGDFAAAVTRLTTRLAVLDTAVDVFLDPDARAELFFVRAVVVLRVELVAARVTFGDSSLLADTCASCCRDATRWSTFSTRKDRITKRRFPAFRSLDFLRRQSCDDVDDC
jgi:hypothetical protein